MIRKLIFLSIFISLFISGVSFAHAKKIKQSLKIENKEKSSSVEKMFCDGREIKLVNNCILTDKDSIIGEDIAKIIFTGYEKEPNSTSESFIVVNGSPFPLTGFDVRIDYLDMKDRMLHSRNITRECKVPPFETRKFDVKSWDIQRTYYYYLGNEPKRVATPYKVRFSLERVWIDE